MTSRNSKRFAASGRAAGLVLAGMLFLGPGLTARAQSADARSRNGLEGTWRVQVTVSDCDTGAVLRTFPALFAFAKGGTVTNTTAGQFPALFTPGFGSGGTRRGGPTPQCPRPSFLAPPEPGYRHTDSLASLRSTATSSPIKLPLKSSTPAVT